MSQPRDPERQAQLHAAVEREKTIRVDPWSAPLLDISWLADRLTQRLRKPDYESYRSDPGVQSWVDDPDYHITRDNDTAYLEFLMNLLSARASIEGANIQANTNAELVRTTRTLVWATVGLVLSTLIVAAATLWAILEST